MSLLVEARLRESKDGFKMDDGMMMQQFVRNSVSRDVTGLILLQLTFLGAGHETTASGLAWVW
jgi:cytochrome P450